MTLSREDLYELAWTKPLYELAKDFKISDVALGKRCKRLGIPVPGRGYWARVDAGQKPYRPKLPKREPHWHDEGALTAHPRRCGSRVFDLDDDRLAPLAMQVATDLDPNFSPHQLCGR